MRDIVVVGDVWSDGGRLVQMLIPMMLSLSGGFGGVGCARLGDF
jgi:hypothetical protein